MSLVVQHLDGEIPRRSQCCPSGFRDGLARVLRGVLRDALRGDDDDEYGVQLRRTLYVLLLRLLW